MSLRTCLVSGAALFAALFAVNCSPPPIRCETNDQCLEDMKCDVRQGLCVDEGEYIENPDGTPDTGSTTRTGSDTECQQSSGKAQ